MLIESVCAAGAVAGEPRRASRELAESVALGCSGERHNGTAHVPLVVYAGVYRDDCILEPAQAPFVQRALGQAAGRSDDHPEGGFSFDVDNLLVALEIADGMIRSRGLERALVVAADGGEGHLGPYAGGVAAAAGAMLVAPGGPDEGFVAWYSKVFPEHRDLRRVELRWMAAAGDEPGRQVMDVAESGDYLGACLSSADSALHEFLAEVGVRSLEGLLVLPSQSPAGFPQGLARRMGSHAGQVVDVSPDSGFLHSAGPIAALDAAVRDGRFARAQQVLWLTVQPGIVVSAALYRPGGSVPKLRSSVVP